MSRDAGPRTVPLMADPRVAQVGHDAGVNRTLLTPIGVLLILVGVLWVLQGTGWLGGSAMSGVAFWAVVGAVLIVAGGVLVVLGRRALRERRARRDAER